MQTTRLFCAVAAALALPAQALIIDLNAGIGSWSGDYAGYLVEERFDVTDTLGLESASTPVHAFAELRHPLPVIPNLRLAYTKINSQGNGTLSETLEFGDETFNAQADITTELDLSHADINLFYELDFIPYLALQAGAGARLYQGGISVTSDNQGNEIKESLALNQFPLPQVSVGARFDVPLTDAYLTGRADGLAYKNNQLVDWSVGAGWEVDLIPLLDMRIEAGWREIRFAIDPSDFGNDDFDQSIDTSVAGAYVNAALVF